MPRVGPTRKKAENLAAPRWTRKPDTCTDAGLCNLDKLNVHLDNNFNYSQKNNVTFTIFIHVIERYNRSRGTFSFRFWKGKDMGCNKFTDEFDDNSGCGGLMMDFIFARGKASPTQQRPSHHRTEKQKSKVHENSKQGHTHCLHNHYTN